MEKNWTSSLERLAETTNGLSYLDKGPPVVTDSVILRVSFYSSVSYDAKHVPSIHTITSRGIQLGQQLCVLQVI